MKPMRTLHVISSIDAAAGGTTSFVRGLAIAQAAAGLSVHVLSTWTNTEPRDVPDALKAAGVNVTLIGPAAGRFVRHPTLARAIDAAVTGADVVHVHALWEEAQHLAAQTARRLAKPYVISPHGMLDPWSLRQSKWAKKIVLAWRVKKSLRRAAALHYLCESERDLVAPMRLGPPSIVEPAGLDLSEFEPLPPRGKLREKLRATHPDIDSRQLVLFLSRLHPKKGLDVLVPAFASAADPHALLVIAGPDPDGYGQTVRDLARKFNVDNRVVFTGMLRGVERVEALVDADLFVLPSYQENFGIAVTESLAAGTPVLISDQVAIWKELVEAGVAAATPPEATAFGAELKRWLSDPALRREAAAKARPFVWAHFDWTAIAARWLAHYAALRPALPL